ncbi:MAG: DJ-1/PfpI family protein [Spirochaetales bacterium]|nr:DJ-1/PfpI family protein [Spirochaetales bacterium]
MKKRFILFRVVFFVLCISFTVSLLNSDNMLVSNGGLILMIIASSNFRDEELRVPKQIFEQNGYQVKIACSTKSTVTGMLGARVNPDLLLERVKVDDYAAVVFVGGGGAEEYYNSPAAHAVARQAFNKGILICAICIAPNILAYAGILTNKQATCFNSEILKAKGAVFTGKAVEQDGTVITANGPQAAGDFARKIITALKQ